MSASLGWRQRPVVVVIAAGMIVLISMGLRQSFGIFMQPLGCVLGIDRESFGLAIALQNLLLGLPLAGYLADRYSARRVAMTGALVYAFAMFLMTEVGGTGGVLIVLGLLTGLIQAYIFAILAMVYIASATGAQCGPPAATTSNET